MVLEARPLGNTGLQVSILGFGGIPIINLPDAEAEAVVKRALDRGVTLIDTARAYHRPDLPVGASEDKIGKAVRGRRDRVVVCTKTQSRKAGAAARDLEESLRRLGTDYVDVWMLHSVDSQATWDEVCATGGALETLFSARRDGKIRFCGISGHRPDVLLDILPQAHFDVIMVPVNIVDRYVCGAETALLPYCEDQGIGVLAMKPLAGGALKEVPSLAIRYCLGQKVSSVVPGMGSLAEVEQNLSAVSDARPLGSDEEELLWQEGRKLGLDFCRQCGYCLPCAAEIDIPTVFRLDGMFRRYGQEQWARGQYATVSPQGSECLECGECESRCPYQLPIRAKLKEAHRRLSSPA